MLRVHDAGRRHEATDDILAKAAALASRTGQRRPAGRDGRAVPASVLPPRRGRGPRRPRRRRRLRRRDEPVPARAATGPRAPRTSGSSPRRSPSTAGRPAGHTVVEVVTDDMSFLVDSVTMELNEQGRSVHMVVHPQLLVRRDVTGELVEVIDDEVDRRRPPSPTSSASRGCTSRSTGSPSAEQLEEIESALRKVLSDVREAVEDWSEDARSRRSSSSRTWSRTRRRCRPRRSSRARRCCSWLADDHFTFLGYREYRLDERRRRRRVAALRACPAPASASCAPTRTCRRRSASCRRWSGTRRARRPCWCWPRRTPRRPCTGRSTSTTSASRRSTRPARSSGSGGSSGCSPRRPTPSR